MEGGEDTKGGSVTIMSDMEGSWFEESTLSSGVVLNADGVDEPNPLAPVEVARFGLGIKFGAKGLSNFEGDGSERKVDFLAGPMVNPLTWGCGDGNALVCGGCPACGVNVVNSALAGVGTKGGKDETDEDAVKPAGVLEASNACV